MIVRQNTGYQCTFRRLTRHHYRIIAQISDCPLAGVQPKIGLPLLGIRPVAGKTIITQQRPNIPGEIDRPRFFLR